MEVMTRKEFIAQLKPVDEYDLLNYIEGITPDEEYDSYIWQKSSFTYRGWIIHCKNFEEACEFFGIDKDGNKIAKGYEWKVKHFTDFIECEKFAAENKGTWKIADDGYFDAIYRSKIKE